MISDENTLKIEGTIYRSPEIMETDGKKVINFTIENNHISKNGPDRQLYNCVAWNKAAEKYCDVLKEGAFVRITGHLQSNTIPMEDGRMFRYAKVCADHIMFEED